MQKHAMWKLAALAAVVAVGFFAVLQTQRGLQDDDPDNSDAVAAKSGEKSDAQQWPAKSRTDLDALTQLGPSSSGNPFGDLPQKEPPDTGPSHEGHKQGDAPKKTGDDIGSGVPKLDVGAANETKKTATPSGDGPATPFPGGRKQPAEHDGFQSKVTPYPKTEPKTAEKTQPLFGSDITKTGDKSDKPMPLFNGDPKITQTDPGASQGAATPSPFAPTPMPMPGGEPKGMPKTEPAGAPAPGPQLFNPEKTDSAAAPDKSGGQTTPTFPAPGKTPATTPAKSGGSDSGSTTPVPVVPDQPTPKQTAPTTPFDGAAAKQTEPAKTSPETTTSNPFGPPPSPKPAPDAKQPAGGSSPAFPAGEPAKKASEKTEPKTSPDSAAKTPPKSLFDPNDDKTAGSPAKLAPTPNAAPIRGMPATDSASAMPTQQPQLTISKSAPRNAVLGKPFVYDILVKNRGRSPAHKVRVTDPIPGGVRLIGTDPQAVLNDNKLFWNLGTIQPGKTRKISVKVTPVRAGQIGSVATVKFVAAVSSKTVIGAAKLTLEMAAPQAAKVGDQVTFRFKLKNTGSTTAKDVWLRDVMPDGLKHQAGRDLEYHVGALAPGKSEDINLTMTVTRSGRLANRAIVTAAGGTRIEKQSVVDVPATKIVIARSGPRARYVGRPAIYQNTLSNGSDATIKTATVTETVPLGMEFVKASDGGKYEPTKRTVTWVVGPLEPKKAHTVTLTLMPKAPGVQHSVVNATAADGTSVRTASATKVTGFAALGIDADSVDRPVRVGEQVALRVIGRNRGTAASSNVQLKVILPKHLRLVGVRGKGKHHAAAGRISFEPIASLAGNEKVAYDLVLKAVAPGDARVSVQIQSETMSKPLSREEAVLILPDK